MFDGKDEVKENQEEFAPLTYKEMKALKKSDYNKISKKFNKIFVLKNAHTGQVVELRAASSFHACNIIGWKPNKVIVIEQKKVEDNKSTETTSTIEKDSKAEIQNAG